MSHESQQLEITHRLSEGTKRFLDRIAAALHNDGSSAAILTAIQTLDRKADQFMATQEERLQAILVAVKNVKQMLADLKTTNPAIEDEIAAIEQELAPAAEPVTPPEG
jgi:thioesterase domain-containing protein